MLTAGRGDQISSRQHIRVKKLGGNSYIFVILHYICCNIFLSIFSSREGGFLYEFHVCFSLNLIIDGNVLEDNAIEFLLSLDKFVTDDFQVLDAKQVLLNGF